MRDVATRRRDWRRLNIGEGPPTATSTVLSVRSGSCRRLRVDHDNGCSPLVRVDYGPPLVSARRSGGTGDASGTSRESRPLLGLRCYGGGAAPRRGTPAGLVGADDRPSGAELSWLPGREEQRCEVLSTRANEKQAQQLVDDVNTAPVIPTDRPYNCPTTNDAELLLVFRYRTGFESLQVMLTGCAGISAPNRYSRFVTQRLRDDLQGLAPTGVRMWAGGCLFALVRGCFDFCSWW